MAYTPKTWADGAGGATPITAAELNRLETGVAQADERLERLDRDALSWFPQRRQPAVHGIYNGWDAGNPTHGQYLTTWGSANIPVILGHEFGDNAQWTYFSSGTNFTNWDAWVAETPGRRFTYSCPLLSAQNPNDYAGLNAGTYDSHFVTLGQAFQAKVNLRNSIVRLGWEFNGSTFPWAIPANSTDPQLTSYKDAYNRIAGILKTECPTLEFEWCPNAHLDNANRLLVDMFPGITYVDYVGLAVYDYYLPGGTPTEQDRYNYLVTGANALEDQYQLAQSVGRPIAFTEWGLWPTAANTGGGDRPEFITLMLDWMREKGAAYSIYNNVNATQDHRLVTYPKSKAAYMMQYGKRA